jgi:pimeloyl-ACP methyl ester carboxylesterase
MAAPRERRVVANGLSHHVLEWGPPEARETFILCHGFLDQARSWTWVAERLEAAGHRAVAFSWRGHGDTEWIGPGAYYHFQDYVLDLHDLWPELAGSGRTHLVGHSMGGSACALFAGTHVGAYATLTLMEGLGPPPSTGTAAGKMEGWLSAMDRARLRRRARIADLAEGGRRLRATHGDLPEPLSLEIAAMATCPHPDGEGLTWAFDPLHRTPSPRRFYVEELTDFLASITAPTLVVTGERGFVTGDHGSRVAAIGGPTAERVLPGVGHMMHWMAPDAVVEALVDVHLR